ncbi:hypothetical protein [Microbacterium sp. H83]|uniref:hypothetical protein n=1 Tax=Microbacterium sp. H83 TaxID=1827324 RepID=UPI0007F3F9CF|nr:hypothetical protein [Microbacterium sp. H83]OAN38406.1 hypothetical protein A4X16_03200 [Microbacterium sp. H83]
MSVPTGFVDPPPGGHTLPPVFHSASPAQRRPRRRAGWLLGALGILLVAGILSALQVAANLGYDEARSDFDDTRTSTRSAMSVVQGAADMVAGTAEVADLLLQSDSGVLVDPAARDALTAAVGDAREADEAARRLLGESIPGAGPKPSFFWELFAASEGLAERTDDLERVGRDLAAQSPELDTANASLTDAGLAVLGSAATAASSFEAAHLSAKNDAVIALRDAATDVTLASALDDQAVGALVALQDAAGQVVASEQAELAEKAGPLQSVRLEIEAFARSLAPGVLIEFDWSPVVNNAGFNGSMGGLTTWWWDEPDRAVIELSNSVAEQWPADRSKALVAHEVGHAISVKCEDMYDSTTQDSIEKWATAWAIGMGFSDDANGVWAYGYPPQSYIDAALACR